MLGQRKRTVDPMVTMNYFYGVWRTVGQRPSKLVDPNSAPLQRRDWDKLRASHSESIFEEARRQFAIEVKSGVNISLSPLENLPVQRRKSLIRRRPKIRPEVRKIAANYRAKGYERIRPTELSLAVGEATCISLTPANAKNIRKRLRLDSLVPGGRPRKS
jgi:hypothetical protein